MLKIILHCRNVTRMDFAEFLSHEVSILGWTNVLRKEASRNSFLLALPPSTLWERGTKLPYENGTQDSHTHQTYQWLKIGLLDFKWEGIEFYK